jgi:hypothetical protein
LPALPNVIWEHSTIPRVLAMAKGGMFGPNDLHAFHLAARSRDIRHPQAARP